MISPENTVFKDPRQSTLSRTLCPYCREETENVAISMKDPLYQKWRMQHGIDCTLLTTWWKLFRFPEEKAEKAEVSDDLPPPRAAAADGEMSRDWWRGNYQGSCDTADVIARAFTEPLPLLGSYGERIEPVRQAIAALRASCDAEKAEAAKWRRKLSAASPENTVFKDPRQEEKAEKEVSDDLP